MSSRPLLNRADCLICGESDGRNLTLEHIIPQVLWGRFGVDPNQGGNVTKTQTTLCKRCNNATSRLHTRSEMLNLIETGAPVTDSTVPQMADWVFWVLLLLELERGNTTVPPSTARAILHARFVSRTVTTIPPGWRVYAAHVTTLANQGTQATGGYEVITPVDRSNISNGAERTIGFRRWFGQSMQSSSTIGIGCMGFLVLPPTESSGPGHQDRVDAAANENGLERLVPRRGATATLAKGNADVGNFRDIFVPPWEGTDRSLLPERLRSLISAFTQG